MAAILKPGRLAVSLNPHRVVSWSIVSLLILWCFVSVVSRTWAAANPKVVYSGLEFPVSFRFAPDGRIFFNEKNTGNVRVIQNGSLLATPFATVAVATDGPEQGLLGLALDPDFAANGFLYIYATVSIGSHYHGQIVRYTAIGNTGNNRTIIFDLTNPAQGNMYHNGGYLRFGPDKKLYVQTGEFQIPQLSQDLSSNAGKILRMNSDGSVPSDNPFQGTLVYARGVRNGFGMDFDPTSGELIETEAGRTAMMRSTSSALGETTGGRIA